VGQARDLLVSQRNPKGCKKVAGGRSPRRPPEKSFVMTAPRRGARPQVVLVKFDTRRVEKISIQVTTQKIATSKDLAPLRGATQLKIPFPVVSADSDHRLLSLQPFGLRSSHFRGSLHANVFQLNRSSKVRRRENR